MASYLDKVQINTAITDNSKLQLDHSHISTADFMELNVATIQELVPGSKIDVNMETFARLNPLVVPTFGRASIRNRAFFVPFRTIYRAWTDMSVDAVHIASDGYTAGQTGQLQQMVPTVDMETLGNVFLSSIVSTSTDNGMLYQVTPNSDNSNWDITYTSGGTTAFYCYTVKGRQAIKTLEALGYKIDWNRLSKDYIFNAMPLLAIAKIYIDWYYPTQYANRVEYDILLALCNEDKNGSTGHKLSVAELDLILGLCSWVNYDSDLFTAAFDQPNSPSSGNYSGNFKLVNIDTIGQVFGSGNNAYNITQQNGVSNRSANAANTGDVIDRYGQMDAPFITGYVGTSSGTVATGGISEYLLHGLHALTDYMKRNQLAGSRAMDRYLARFGKALPAEKLNRSLYLGSALQNIQIGDVMSTADTTTNNASGDIIGAQLGTFSGKGISYGNGHFDFSTDEFGYFIIMSSIVPATGYFQGIDPMVERKFKLDFWSPEFENLGVEALEAANLYIPQVAGQMTQGNPFTQIFGYVPRYATYKAPTCMDRLTGNFRVPSINQGAFVNGANSWHLMRTFRPQASFNDDYANVVHSPGFLNGYSDAYQYKRLFYDDLPDAPDNFTIIHNFEITEYAPMKPLYDTYEFEDKGKKVTLETNGVKLN